MKTDEVLFEVGEQEFDEFEVLLEENKVEFEKIGETAGISGDTLVLLAVAATPAMITSIAELLKIWLNRRNKVNQKTINVSISANSIDDLPALLKALDEVSDSVD